MQKIILTLNKGDNILCFPVDVQADLDLLLGNERKVQKRVSGLFLLKMKEQRRISQVAIDDIVEECSSLFSHSVQRLYARVHEKLASSGIELNSVEGLQDVFQNVPSPFEGLETRYKQEKFFRETLNLVVCFNSSQTFSIMYEP